MFRTSSVSFIRYLSDRCANIGQACVKQLAAQCHCHHVMWIPQRRRFTNSGLYKLQSGTEAQSVLQNLTVSTSHVDDILNQVSSLPAGTSGDELSQILQTVCDRQYTNLLSLPWLHRNKHIAHIQFSLMDSLTENMLPLLNDLRFQSLVDKAVTKIPEMSNKRLTEAMLALLFLGIEKTDSIMYLFLNEIANQISTYDISSLCLLSEVYRSLPRPGMVTALRPFLQQLDSHLLNGTPLTPVETYELSRIGINIMSYVSERLKRRISQKINQAVEQTDALQNPTTIGSVIWLGQKLYIDPNGDKITARDIIDAGIHNAMKLAPELDPSHVAEICHHLKRSRCYTKEMHDIFSVRALELASSDLRLADISNLMYAFLRITPVDIKRTFENLLMSRMHDIDVIVLSNLAQSCLDMDLRNKDLIHAFQKQAVNLADKIVRYNTGFQRVIKFLVHRRFVDKELENQFTDILMKFLDREYGMNTWMLSTIGSFVVSKSRHMVPEKMQEKLLTAIPKWRSTELHRMASSLGKVSGHKKAVPLRRQVDELSTQINPRIAEKMEEVPSLDYLYRLSRALISGHHQDPMLVDKMMHLYLNFTKNINDVGLMKTIEVFRSMNYWLPEVYDDLTQYVVQNSDWLDTDKPTSLLTACSAVSYVPKSWDRLLPLVLNSCEKLLETGNLGTILLVTLSLAQLQSFPQPLLNIIFSLEFLHQLDTYIAANAGKAKVMRQRMMQLNRSVVLECPELNVPWFHEQYCKEQIVEEESVEHSFNLRFRDEVASSLEELLGGKQYFRRWVYSPYYHLIHFECILGRNKLPIIMDHVHEVPESFTRVAICAGPRQNYCYNGNKMRGASAMKKRQLEILGYKYVEIPHFEWFSMALQDKSAKLSYLEQKVLKER